MKKLSLLLFLVMIAAAGRAEDQVMNLDHPVREISIIASNTGYYPDAPTAFVGERVRFFVTTTTEDKRCLLLPDKNVFLSMEKGKIDEGEFVVMEPGVYKFHCPTGKMHGALTVLQRPDDKRREIASEAAKRVKIWFPKERPEDY